jgi:hypothetical protein
MSPCQHSRSRGQILLRRHLLPWKDTQRTRAMSCTPMFLYQSRTQWSSFHQLQWRRSWPSHATPGQTHRGKRTLTANSPRTTIHQHEVVSRTGRTESTIFSTATRDRHQRRAWSTQLVRVHWIIMYITILRRSPCRPRHAHRDRPVSWWPYPSLRPRNALKSKRWDRCPKSDYRTSQRTLTTFNPMAVPISRCPRSSTSMPPAWMHIISPRM